MARNIYPEEAPYKPSRAALRERFGSRAIVSYGPEFNPRNATGPSKGSNFDEIFGPKGANGVRGLSAGPAPVAAPVLAQPPQPPQPPDAIEGVPGSVNTPTGYSFANKYGTGSSTGVFPDMAAQEQAGLDHILSPAPSSALTDPDSYLDAIISGSDSFMSRRKKRFGSIGQKPSKWEEEP